MGICQGSNMTPEEAKAKKEEEARSKNLDKTLQTLHQQQETVHKLLLLGAGESGKSTLFKQMVSIHGEGFKTEERKGYTSIIHGNILQSLRVLCEQSDRLSQQPFGEETQVKPEANQIKKFFQHDVKLDSPIDEEMAKRIDYLWRDAGIRRTYELRAKFQLTDSTDYFLNDIMRVSKANYIPTEDDVLRSRVRTTGIVEKTFRIDGNDFKMFDVGGQRNERKKWIHCFEDVTAVLFVAALNEYDMVLFEDENQNRMTEALALFDEICNSRWFKKTNIILMLNKRDLFKDKIAKVPLSACPDFLSYNGPMEYDSCVDFVQRLFESKKKDARKQIYTHVTCATDKDQMRHVFNAVKDIVIRRSLQEGGLLY